MIRVVTDSTSDILPAEAQRLGVDVVPLTVRFGDEQFRDGVDLGPDEFYRRLPTTPVQPSTSQPTPEQFAEVYRRHVSAGDSVVVRAHLGEAQRHAAVGDAWPRRSSPPARVRVVDSMTVSAGIQFLVRAALADIAAGCDVDEVEARSRRSGAAASASTSSSTPSPTCSAAAASAAPRACVGGILNVKPLLCVRDGEVHPEARVRKRASRASTRWSRSPRERPLEAARRLPLRRPGAARPHRAAPARRPPRRRGHRRPARRGGGHLQRSRRRGHRAACAPADRRAPRRGRGTDRGAAIVERRWPPRARRHAAPRSRRRRRCCELVRRRSGSRPAPRAARHHHRPRPPLPPAPPLRGHPRVLTPVAQLRAGEVQTAQVRDPQRQPRAAAQYKKMVAGRGLAGGRRRDVVGAVWFNQRFLVSQLRSGMEMLVSGKVESSRTGPHVPQPHLRARRAASSATSAAWRPCTRRRRS